MSYTIIKRIQITEKSVIITGASNNVYPRTYYTQESPYYSCILREQGREAVEKQILKQYLESNFQGNDKYSFAVDRTLLHEKLVRQEEWDKCRNEKYETQLLEKLYSYYTHPPKKQKCYIRHKVTGRKLLSVTSQSLYLDSEKYKIFPSVDHATIYLGKHSLFPGQFEIIVF